MALLRPVQAVAKLAKEITARNTLTDPLSGRVVRTTRPKSPTQKKPAFEPRQSPRKGGRRLGAEPSDTPDQARLVAGDTPAAAGAGQAARPPQQQLRQREEAQQQLQQRVEAQVGHARPPRLRCPPSTPLLQLLRRTWAHAFPPARVVRAHAACS